MESRVGFFNPVDALGLANGWVIQSDGVKTSQQRAQGLKADGDEAAKKLYDKKGTVSLTYENFTPEGELVLPSVGEIKNGYHIDSLNLSPQVTGWPVLTIEAHKHLGGATHADASCRIYKPSLTFEAGWGIERGFGGFDLAIGDTAIGVKTTSYSLTCTHVDELHQGVWIAGENRDGVEKFDIAFTGVGATITPPASWDRIDDGTDRTNQASDSDTASYEHHVAAETTGP